MIGLHIDMPGYRPARGQDIEAEKRRADGVVMMVPDRGRELVKSLSRDLQKAWLRPDNIEADFDLCYVRGLFRAHKFGH